MNVFYNLARAARSLPEHPALIYEDQTLSYRVLHHRSLTFAAHLATLGVVAGDLVALFLPNVPAFVIAYHAAQALGAVPVSIGAMSTPREVTAVLDDCSPVALVTHADLANQLPELGPHATKARICVGDETPECFEPWPNLTGERVVSPVDRQPHDPAAVLYTSGTTGEPKGVVLSQMNIVSNVASVALAQGLKPTDRVLCFLPLFHCFGQNHIVGGAIRAGATVVLQRRFDLDAVCEVVPRLGISCLYGVPTVYRRLLAHPGIDLALRPLRYSFSAAAAMDSATVVRWAEAFGQPIWEGYGLTETSPFATYNHPLGYLAGTVGVPIDGVEVAIERDGVVSLEMGARGEVVVRGPNVMLGYLGRPSETQEALRGGWFHTGDLGLMDERGALTLVDRLKDMINTAGFKVWPREVEGVLSDGPGVAEVSVVGRPDPDRGEVVVAAIVPSVPGRFDPEALSSWAKERLAPYKRPQHFMVCEQLPISPSGKVLRRVLRESAMTLKHPGLPHTDPL